ncbi:hypothetical protein [Prosthecochloris sp. CIB 2401]|uniref:hypothetical protein n=1 Tax=Prosthecochloris sp. CIB 2401 TaxID=1868325 RepID=UPI0012EAF448|nr:hypothetical protein [Prosthecochloris sp. CIB 2401]
MVAEWMTSAERSTFRSGRSRQLLAIDEALHGRYRHLITGRRVTRLVRIEADHRQIRHVPDDLLSSTNRRDCLGTRVQHLDPLDTGNRIHPVM